MENEYDYLFKILLVGDTGVGKSSILYRFTDNKFSTVFPSTIGVDFKIKQVQIDDKIAKLQIWDTAGQERFRTITQSYYRGAHGIFLVFDFNNIISFKNLEGWLDEIRRYASASAQIIVIGNKVEYTSLNRVEDQEVDNFCNKHNLEWYPASAYKGINIERIFAILAKKLAENTKKYAENHDNIITLQDTGKKSIYDIAKSCCV